LEDGSTEVLLKFGMEGSRTFCIVLVQEHFTKYGKITRQLVVDFPLLEKRVWLVKDGVNLVEKKQKEQQQQQLQQKVGTEASKTVTEKRTTPSQQKQEQSAPAPPKKVWVPPSERKQEKSEQSHQ
jgi:large-conductance mechanosensitive channel